MFSQSKTPLLAVVAAAAFCCLGWGAREAHAATGGTIEADASRRADGRVCVRIEGQFYSGSFRQSFGNTYCFRTSGCRGANVQLGPLRVSHWICVRSNSVDVTTTFRLALPFGRSITKRYSDRTSID